VKANQASFPVRVRCRVLKISKSGFYAWLARAMSDRERTDIALTAKIHAIHRRSREAYGAPMIHAELADVHAIRVGRKRVARLMRLAGLRGVQMKRFVRTTIPDVYSAVALDRVDRRFEAPGPDRLWVADITYIPTWSGFLYLAMVLDVWSRRIVGLMTTPFNRLRTGGGDYRYGLDIWWFKSEVRKKVFSAYWNPEKKWADHSVL
jgi:putative transposase